MKKIILGISVCILLILGALSFFLFQPPAHKTVIRNPLILTEINRLLLPVANQSIRVEDFRALKELVASDTIAVKEVHELEVLARLKEYAHVGHGLGSLYQYIRTSIERSCAEHALAHSYVFAKHGERELAEHHLDKARESVEKQGARSERVVIALARIDAGNLTASEEEIAELSDAECS